MEPEIRPEPTRPERTALERVLAELDVVPRPPDAGAWWRAGIREATGTDAGIELANDPNGSAPTSPGARDAGDRPRSGPEAGAVS